MRFGRWQWRPNRFQHQQLGVIVVLDPSPAASVPRRRGHIYVFCAIGLFSVLAGALAYRMFNISQVHIKAELIAATESGRVCDPEGCVTHVMAWYGRCAAMKSLCDSSVERMMGACLAGRDRAQECVPFIGRARDTHFGFEECKARGVDRWNKKACGNAYRSIDHFCSRKGEG